MTFDRAYTRTCTLLITPDEPVLSIGTLKLLFFEAILDSVPPCAEQSVPTNAPPGFQLLAIPSLPAVASSVSVAAKVDIIPTYRIKTIGK